MEDNLQEAQSKYLNNLGIEKLNEMQGAFIKKANNGNNLMLLAPTGSGKTLAFLLPLIHQLKSDVKGIQALIIAPSRELTLQIEQVFRAMKTSFKVSSCYGGHGFKIEQNSLQENPALVIGTPGRLQDHVIRGSFNTDSISIVVLDEFDKSLQLGFHEQLKTIFHALNGEQQHLLTSATRLDKWPEFLTFSYPETVSFLRQEAYSRLKLGVVHTDSIEKAQTLMKLVARFKNEVCLVFCNHRDAVERISLLLNDHDFAHGTLHGGMEQIDREKNLIKFRGGACNVLVATDLAARGLDIPEIKHVVHYQLPPKEDAFIHRNGRTARMHAEGQAYLVLAHDESLPDYMEGSVEDISIDNHIELPAPPDFVSVYISAGKKNKISKGDILGLLTKKGGLSSADIGLITVLDFSSYVSVKREKVTRLLAKVKHEKLKKQKVKMEEAN
ncbi:DEAD/DEAH box helicase [Litoribacter alkaliphilus]|uniref:DEAD/DEAH box helicase n=1 Tax=Litoribacter ruber TaxID=702568 RepID=A0AAP2CGP0_9BACT|nr:DEAD/DEAH box helicase [Litoribacter alkaliphilus]MBS9523229.1 DEAD/DEAH box helicase [Litoribacter alkaliphilus]